VHIAKRRRKLLISLDPTGQIDRPNDQKLRKNIPINMESFVSWCGVVSWVVSAWGTSKIVNCGLPALLVLISNSKQGIQSTQIILLIRACKELLKDPWLANIDRLVVE